MSSKIRTRARTRLMVALVVMAAMMFALMPGTASAGSATVAVQGTATLNAGISATCTTNIYDGTFSGTAAGLHGTAAQAPAPVSASFKYCNQDTVLGTANGSITIAGHTCGFTWVRRGALALVTLTNSTTSCHNAGTAVAAFAPTSAPGAVPGSATVIGAGVLPVST